MDLRDLVSRCQSRVIAREITSYVGDSQDRLLALLEIFYSGDSRLCQRASWPLTLVAEGYPSMILPHLPSLLDMLRHPPHNAVVRNVCRIVSMIADPPMEVEGVIYEVCLPIMDDPKQPIANRVFAMTACANIAVKYPALAEELAAMIISYLADGSPGIKSRGSKEVARLQKAYLP